MAKRALKNDHNFTLIYDGDCGFCLRVATFISSRSSNISITPYQNPSINLKELGISDDLVAKASVLVRDDGKYQFGADAILDSFKSLPQPYKILVRILQFKPFIVFTREVYSWVNENRGAITKVPTQCGTTIIDVQSPPKESSYKPSVLLVTLVSFAVIQFVLPLTLFILRLAVPSSKYWIIMHCFEWSMYS